MKNLKRVALLPLLFLLVFTSVSYALSNSKITATVTVISKLMITIISPKNATYNKDCVPLTFTINNPVSKIFYNLDSKGNKTIKGNNTLDEMSEGEHNVIVYATDKFNHTANSTKVYFTIAEGLLGYVDIGKMNDGMADLSGWSKPQPKTSGGNVWGGVADKTYWRTVSCPYCKWGDSAYAFVPTGENAKAIRIEFLDRAEDDSFDVYVLDFFRWVKIGHYADQYSDSVGHNVTKDFQMPSNAHISGWVEVEIVATGKRGPDYSKYGQLAIHKIDTLGVAECETKFEDDRDNK